MSRSAIFKLLIVLIAFGFSCAPAKKQTYLREITAGPLTTQTRTFKEIATDYKLQPGDVIRITVTSLTPTEFDFFTLAEESNDLRVDPLLTGYLLDINGRISLPYIGSVLLQGLTVNEAQDKLTQVIAEYLDSPTVGVRLVSFDFSVIGEVVRQGKFSILENRINILEGLGLAGGLTEFANYETVRIIRTENGTSSTGHVNLLAENLPASRYYYLKPNDVIIVDQLSNKNFRLNSSRNITLILTSIGTAITLILAIDNLSN